MNIPLISSITLCTELLVTASVFFVIWKGYRTGAFLRWLAFPVLAYEVLFNITYMASREASGQGTTVYSPYDTAVAIVHGTFSLVMFIALLVFFIVAARAYARSENFFLKHKRLTLVFLIAWSISILSGVLFFVSLYLV